MVAVTHTADPTKRNVFVLAICQALAMSSMSLLITISAIVGSNLAPTPGQATLPLAIQFLGMVCTTLPASMIMRRWGRRAGFTFGAGLGALGGGLAMAAVFLADFWMLCAGSLLIGAAAAHAQYYRFAAADTASENFKSRAISLVLAGGVLAAFLGPELAKQTRTLFEPVLFAGGFFAIVVLMLLTMLLLRFVRIPVPTYAPGESSGRPLPEIMRQPVFIVAALCAMVAYGTMNLVMVSTPLAMLACAHPFESAAFVIQAHVLGMYAPSFFTGHLIDRFGLKPVMGLGALLLLGCVAVNVSGIALANFTVGLVMLGLGWNFLFIGGTAMLTEAYRPEEKAKVQAVNDFLVFGTVAITAFSSGAVYELYGWNVLNFALIAPVVLALGSLIWLSGRRRLESA
jgi:MFS family permease